MYPDTHPGIYTGTSACTVSARYPSQRISIPQHPPWYSPRYPPRHIDIPATHPVPTLVLTPVHRHPRYPPGTHHSASASPGIHPGTHCRYQHQYPSQRISIPPYPPGTSSQCPSRHIGIPGTHSSTPPDAIPGTHPDTHRHPPPAPGPPHPAMSRSEAGRARDRHDAGRHPFWGKNT